MTLTSRQQEIAAYLRQHQRTTGVMPSTREIQRHFGFASQTAAISHLRALERKGVIRKLANKARALIFLDDPDRAPAGVPVYGTIPAGMPDNLDGEPEMILDVDATTFGVSPAADVFALRVRGDSMTDAAILPGDYVILAVKDAHDGDIVAALTDGETTLKRLVRHNGNAGLKAENPRYPDVTPVNELSIQGVMIGLVRRHG